MRKVEYIALQDLDDISMPDRLEKEVEFLEKNKNVGLVGIDYFFINEKDKIVHSINCLAENRKIKEKLLEGNQFAHGSIVFKKTCVEKIGMYREEFKFTQDYDFALRISEEFDVANISEPLYKWRINVNSVSVKKKMFQDKYASLAIELAKERKRFGKDKLQTLKREEVNDFLDRYLISSSKGQNKKEIAEGYYFYGLVLLNGRDYKGALRLLTKSFIIHPLDINNWLLFFKTLMILFLPKQIINCLGVVKNFKFK